MDHGHRLPQYESILGIISDQLHISDYSSIFLVLRSCLLCNFFYYPLYLGDLVSRLISLPLGRITPKILPDVKIFGARPNPCASTTHQEARRHHPWPPLARHLL